MSQRIIELLTVLNANIEKKNLSETPAQDFYFINLGSEYPKEEMIAREFMASILSNLAQGENLSNMSIFELVRLLHQSPTETCQHQLSFATPLQRETKCLDAKVKCFASTKIEAYRLAWENLTNVPCENGTIYNHWENIWKWSEDYANCCELPKSIQNQLPTILKVMKYSIQPVSYIEPLNDFLKSFDNLDFLPYDNLTTFTKCGSHPKNTCKRNLMETNINPQVLWCQYKGKPESFSAEPNCNSFHTSLTNEGFGYSFNQANIWDIFSGTQYMKLYSKILRPKGYDLKPSSNYEIYPNQNISFPITSGPSYGLQVCINVSDLEYI